MPVYQYEGVHYDLPDGLTNEQAISKIKAHLGKTDTPTYTDSQVNSSIPVPAPVSKSEWDDNSPLPRHIMPFNKDMSLAKPYDENNPMGAYLNPEGMLSALKVGAYNVAAMPAMLGGAWASLGKSPKEQEEIMKDWMKHATRIRESTFGDKEEQGQQAIDTLMNEVGIPMMGIGHGSFRPEAYSKKPIGTPKLVVPGSPEATRAALAEQNKPAAPLPPSDPTQFSGVGSEYAQLQQIKQRLLGSKEPEDKATLAAIEQRLTELNTAAYTQRLRGNQLGFQGDLANVGDALNSFDALKEKTGTMEQRMLNDANATSEQMRTGEQTTAELGNLKEQQEFDNRMQAAQAAEQQRQQAAQAAVDLRNQSLAQEVNEKVTSPVDLNMRALEEQRQRNLQQAATNPNATHSELAQRWLDQKRQLEEGKAELARRQEAQAAAEKAAQEQAAQQKAHEEKLAAIERDRQAREQQAQLEMQQRVNLERGANTLAKNDSTPSPIHQRWVEQQRLLEEGKATLAQRMQEAKSAAERQQIAEQQARLVEQERAARAAAADEAAKQRQTNMELDVKRNTVLGQGAADLAKTGIPPTPEALKAAASHPDVIAAAKKVTNAEASLQRAVESANAKGIKAARTKLENAKATLETTRNKVAQSPKGEGGIVELNSGLTPPKALRETLSKAIMDAFDKYRFTERRANGEVELPKGMRSNDLKRTETLAFRKLNKLVLEHVGRDQQKALNLLSKLNTEDSIHQALKDGDDRRLSIYKVSAPEEYAAVKQSFGNNGIIEMNAGAAPSKAVRDWLNTVHPELAAMGVTPKMVELYKRIHAMEQGNRDLIYDPYLVPKGQKIAYSRLNNSFINSILDKKMNYGLVMQAFDRISGKDRLRTNLDYLHDGPHVTENPLGKDIIDLNSGLRFPKRQRGVIDPDLLGVGSVHSLISKLLTSKFDKKTNSYPPHAIASFLKKYDGTFNRSEIVRVVNESIMGRFSDSHLSSHLVLMSPRAFHSMAAARSFSQKETSPISLEKRQRIRNGLDTKEGLDAIPYLIIDENGKVVGHEGRHRMDVFENKGLDKVPVQIRVKNMGDMPKRIKAEGEDNYRSHWFDLSDRLITEENRANWNGHQFEDPKTPKRYNQPEVNGVHPYDIPGTTDMNIGIPIPQGVKDFFSEVSDNVDRNLKGLKFYNPEKEKGKLMDNITGLDTSSVLAKPDAPENVIQAAIHSSDTPSILASVQSGAGLTASKFNNNPLIQHVGRTIKYAYQMAEKGQRELVAPVKKAFNSLARDDFRLLMGVLRDESINFDSNGNVVPYSRASLEQTLSRRQLAAYDMLRAAQDKILDIENKGRAILGKDPITAREAYMASRWEGDWHAPVLDKDGKLVWYIRENSKGDAKRAIEYLKQNFGDNLALDGVEPQYRATNFAAGTPRDVIGAYHDMMEFMKDNNPGLVEHMENAMAEYQSQKGYTIAGQNKHFLNKAGVRGYLGDQPWKSESVNANNLGRSQIDYMNNALHWAHMQEAIANLKEVLSNEEVASKQKNAVQYSSLLMANELGSIQPQWLKGFEGAVAQALGTSKGSLYKGVGSVKTLGYLQLLGLSPGYMIATPLQALMTVPSWHMRLSGEGFKHNVAKTSLLALGDFSAAMAEHAAHNLGKESVRLPMSDLGRAADQYAQQSGMVSKNLFGESGIGQHEATQRIGDLAGWTIGLPEKVARYSTFLSFAHHLEASGKYASRAELFRHAEELTDNALTSFRSADRPLIVNQAGATGQAMYMLKSFVFNSYNQLSSHARQANKAPLLAMLAMTGIMGGAMALPLMDEMDKMFSLIKKAVAHVAPDKGSDIHQAPSLRELSFSLGDKMGPLKTIIQSGAVSAATGAQMKSRFSMGTGITDLAAPAQEMKENGAILKAAINPTKDQMLAGLHANMPPLIQGQMEANLDAFKDKNNPQIAYRPTTLGDNPQAINHKRTPEDWNYRKLGLKSLAEANDVETANLNREHELNRQTALTKLSGYLTSSIKNGDKEAIASNIKAIYKLEPDVDISALIGQKAEQLHLTPEQRDIIHMQSVNAIRDYQRLQGMRK